MEGKAMKIVNSHCSQLMDRYTQCVDKYPNVWYSACSNQRHEVARCSETHPVMLTVKSQCQSLFQKYEKCQRSHPDNATYCADQFNAFLDCVEMVADRHS